MGLKGFLFEKELTLKFHDELHPSIWDVESDNAEPTLLPEIRTKLLEIAKTWAEYANIPEKHIKNILFTGSLANYNYTDKSDIDLHVLVDYDSISKDFDFIYDYFKDKKLLWSHNHNITIKGFPVELYAQPMSEKPHTNQGVYSVSSNKWIQAPKPVEIKPADDVVFMKKLQSFKEQIDDILAGKGTVEGIEKLKEKLRNMRGASIGKSGEFSQENLIFKELRNSEYLDKLTKYHREQIDKELSLESVKNVAIIKARELKKKLKERLGESITDEPEQEEYDGIKEQKEREVTYYRKIEKLLLKLKNETKNYLINPRFENNYLVGENPFNTQRNRPPKEKDTIVKGLIRVGDITLEEDKQLLKMLYKEGLRYFQIETSNLYVSKDMWADNWKPLIKIINESITDEPEEEENDTPKFTSKKQIFDYYGKLADKIKSKFLYVKVRNDGNWVSERDDFHQCLGLSNEYMSDAFITQAPRRKKGAQKRFYKIEGENAYVAKEVIDYLKSIGFTHAHATEDEIYVSLTAWHPQWGTFQKVFTKPVFEESITDEPEEEERDIDTIKNIYWDFLETFPKLGSNNDSLYEIDLFFRNKKYQGEVIPDIRMGWNELIEEGKSPNYFNYAMTNTDNLQISANEVEKDKYMPWPHAKGYYVNKKLMAWVKKHQRYATILFDHDEDDENDSATVIKFKGY